MSVKRGQRVTLQIEELTTKGDGLAREGGVEIVVRGTVPGDCVEAVVGRKRRGRLEARVQEVLHVRLSRKEPFCGHFGTCGGCRWQDLSYSDQLRLKEEMVRRSLAARDIIPGEFWPVLASPSSLYYRNKMEFSFGRDAEGGDLQIGLHVRERYNLVFDLEACYLQSELSNRVVDSVRRHAVASGLPVYDLRTHEGLLRFLVVRESKVGGGGVMINLVVSQYPHEGIDELVHVVTGEVPEISTFVVTLHTGKAQVALGEGEYILKGEGHIVEECGGLKFQISPQSFFQTNTEQAENLYRLIRDLAGDTRETDVLDLYCGPGGIGLHLARESRSVVGIEQTVEAVEDARLNAQSNAIENCTFISGKIEDVLSAEWVQGKRFDLVVVDPPRPGIHKKVLAALSDLAPAKIIYVSCNAESLADDVSVLVLAGYRMSVVQPVDLFPQTPHCEVVAVLER